MNKNMATDGKLKVGNKEVFIKNVTYDDLIILYQQYINTYHEMPLAKKCDIEHNMPYRRKIISLLDENDVSEKEFISQFENGLMLQKSVEKQIELNKSKFPITIDNVTYNTFGDVGVLHKDSGHYMYYFNLIDNEGYKYYITYNSITNAANQHKPLNRFFKGNKYTYDNINLFCKLNNIDLHIDGTGLEVKGLARTPLNFYNSNGEKVVIPWNYIQRRYNKNDNQSSKIIIKNNLNISKQEIIKIIKDKELQLGRPLLQCDFEGEKLSKTSVGIRQIYDNWGNFNNMINDLNLKKHDAYYKPNLPNYLSHEEIMNEIQNVCNNARKEGKTTLMRNDFNTNKVQVARIISHCKLENTTLRDEVKKYGCELQQPGMGFIHIFEDGEKVISNYEYVFSNFLKKIGFKYNKNYFRDVLYSDIDSNFKGKINCDYKVTINGINYYFELAGILGNIEHQSCYLTNTKICNSKSKEEYRLKLNLKKEIFEKNNINYFILLPKDMNEDNYNKIFKNIMTAA